MTEASGPEIEFVEFPTIRFVMGSDEFVGEPDDDEGPSREVTVGRFEISRLPVTVANFGRFVESTGFETVAELEDSGFVGAHPRHELLIGATWRYPNGPLEPPPSADVAVTQVAWTDARAFCEWSNTSLPTEAQWERIGQAMGAELSPSLGSHWEWCADYYDAEFHRDEQRVNPTGPHHGTHRVARGGSTRITERAAFLPDFGASDLTFRVCR